MRELTLSVGTSLRFLRSFFAGVVLVFACNLSAFSYKAGIQPNLSLAPGGEVDVPIKIEISKGASVDLSKISTGINPGKVIVKVLTKEFDVVLKSLPESIADQSNFTGTGIFIITVFETGGKATGKKVKPLKIELALELKNAKTGKVVKTARVSKSLKARIIGEKKLQTSGPKIDEVKWVFEPGEAFRRAKEENKQVLVYHTASWCGACHFLDKGLFREPRVYNFLNEKMIPLYADYDKSEQYRYMAVPQLAILSADEAILNKSLPRTIDGFLKEASAFVTDSPVADDTTETKDFESLSLAEKMQGKWLHSGPGITFNLEIMMVKGKKNQFTAAYSLEEKSLTKPSTLKHKSVASNIPCSLNEKTKKFLCKGKVPSESTFCGKKAKADLKIEIEATGNRTTRWLGSVGCSSYTGGLSLIYSLQ